MSSKELKVTAEGEGKKFKISAINNGTVLDRIPAGYSLSVFKLLALKTDDLILIGVNLESEKLGKKDVLKIENKYLNQLEIDKLAIVSYNAKMPITISIIKAGKKTQKFEVDLPDILINVAKCKNPKCICSIEPHTVTTRFYVQSKKPLIVKCHYCERKMREKEIELL